jgi:hypothetical protein
MSKPQGLVRLKGLGKLKKFSHLIGSRTHDIPTVPTERPPLVGVVPTFAGRGCHVVSVTDPYSRILGFLDWSRYFSFK